MPKVHLRASESKEQLFRRFRKAVAKAGTMSEVRRRRWFVPDSETRRIEKKKAARRMQRKNRSNR